METCSFKVRVAWEIEGYYFRHHIHLRLMYGSKLEPVQNHYGYDASEPSSLHSKSGSLRTHVVEPRPSKQTSLWMILTVYSPMPTNLYGKHLTPQGPPLMPLQHHGGWKHTIKQTLLALPWLLISLALRFSYTDNLAHCTVLMK
ncbi:hypothetical protein E4T56_gene1717 [Termitomyces sp. T112]|nr:hypothetical protein E4T56_gene1717 [Termitomyces sp. T112]